MELQQRLVPTVRLDLRPLLIQAVRLLPLSQIELRQHLLQEYLQNPALEVQSDEEGPSLDELAAPQAPPEGEPSTGDDDEWLSQVLDETRFELPSPIEEREPAEEDWIWERRIESPRTLLDHLRWQIAMAPVDETTRSVMYFLAEFINPSGYIEETEEELAGLAGVSVEAIYRARQHLLRLDPVGVGARTLRECLMVQLEALGQTDTDAYRILQEAWDEFVQKRWDDLVRRLGLSREALRAALEVIYHLDPRPAQAYTVHQLLYVHPDVIVREQDGEYVVELSRAVVPRVTISRRYLRLLRDRQNLSPEERQYIRERILAARRLLRTLNYCESTLLRIARHIVQHQRAFLEQGLSGLKPLSLRDVARALSLHESTVSRAVQHKYMQTPRGTFELRFFFQRRVSTQSAAQEVSATTVKYRIRELIQSESPQEPLTDEALARLLRFEGIQISRRAVTKYRLEMSIPSARQRRRMQTA
ncbi:MAG: RNA polymerase factor sigma-54 [Acidobacteria bacterium]|nr:RNA polymerase factor sigma-54 [Acidobacteriota bacterium]MDW7983465.1 RNA polymerase factor sigma-54 [Acidobacteriota bacterium]